MKLSPILANPETSKQKCMNKFVGEQQATGKMNINSAKSWFAVERGCNYTLLTDYI